MGESLSGLARKPVLEDLLQRNLEARQQRSRQDVSRGCGEQGSAPQAFVSPLPDLSRFADRIEDPVLPRPEFLVGLAFEDFVQAAAGVGEDLDDQVRRALNVGLRDDRASFVGDEEEIGLNDIVRGEDHVRRGQQDLAERVQAKEGSDVEVEGPDEPLVPDKRRGGHEMLPADDLVAFPVVREEEVVLVGELGGRVVKSHGYASCDMVAPPFGPITDGEIRPFSH